MAKRFKEWDEKKMEFVFSKFIENLKNTGVKASYKNKTGLGKVIDTVWNHYHTSKIDFASFSYEDVIHFYDEWENLFEYSDTDEMMHSLGDNNVLNSFDQIQGAIIGLFHSEDKRYESDLNDNFFF